MTALMMLVKTSESRTFTHVSIYNPDKLLGQIEGVIEGDDIAGDLDVMSWQWMTNHFWNLIDQGIIQMIPAPMDSRFYFFKLSLQGRQQIIGEST